MATLGNLLKMRGGQPFTHRVVTLTLLLPDPKSGTPEAVEQQVALLPVTHAAEARANRAAIEYCAARKEFGDAPLLDKELKFRFCIEAMRDAANLAAYFVDEDSIESFREVVIGEQLDYLLREYSELLAAEFVELQAKPIKDEARETFQGG